MLCSRWGRGFEFQPGSYLDRREALTTGASLLSAWISSPLVAKADTETSVLASKATANSGFQAYSIIPDASASLSPNLISLEV